MEEGRVVVEQLMSDRLMEFSRRRFIAATSLGVVASSPTLLDRSKAFASPQFPPNHAQPASPLLGSVRDLGIQFMDNPLGITGQDAATSVVLPSGDAFWIFGDTIEGPFDSIRYHDLSNSLSNTAAIVPKQQDVTRGIRQFNYLATNAGTRARQFVEYLPDEDPAKHRLWAVHGVCVGDDIYVYYHKITMHANVDVFEEFEANGMGIARARIGEYKFRRLHAPDGSTMFWKGGGPGYGVFVEAKEDGYLYLWGSFWTGMYLARTRPETIEDLTSYEYLVDGPTVDRQHVEPTWSDKYNPQAALFDSVPNEMSAAYNAYLGKYVAVHTLLRDNKIVMRTAPRITGPWSEPHLLYRPPRTSSDDIFNAGKEHPELQRHGGKVIYITYVTSTEYAPHLIEVTLA